MDQSASSFLFSLASKIAYGLLAGLVGLSAFLGRQWLRSERKAQVEREKAQEARDEQFRIAISDLAKGIRELNGTLGKINETQIRHDEQLKNVRQDVDDLKESMCAIEDCPNRRA